MARNMSWLPICLFLALFANAKLESEFIHRLPRDAESTTTAATPTTEGTSTTTAGSTTEGTTTAGSTTAGSTTAGSTTEGTTTAGSTTEGTTTAGSTTAGSTTEGTTTPGSTTEGTTTKKPDTPEGLKKDGDECDANSVNNIVCENDKLIFCGPNNQIMSVQCIVKGKQGYCNCEKTGCVKDKPVCPNDKTKCYEPNTKLPDNMDCHKFTYCNQDKEKLTFECPEKLIYDMKEERCTDRSSARCHRVVCPRPGNSVQLMPFPQARNFYVLCYRGIGDVRKCPDEFYGIRENACKFECKLKGESGLFKDTKLESCKKGVYYACRKSGSSYNTYTLRCPPGETFDEDIGICTKEDNCKSESENA